MKIIIESPHITDNSLLQTYEMEKATKLAHIDERLVKCEVMLKLENSSTDDNKICEMSVVGDGKKLFASERSKTFEDAINRVVHALENQLRKQKITPRHSGKKIEMDNDYDLNEKESLKVNELVNLLSTKS